MCEGFEMVWRSVALVARQAVLRINGRPTLPYERLDEFREIEAAAMEDAPGTP